ncbi:hypothetical protein O1611_g454 [Lasiodiplodia mahajangana]|uniref:Uncharacterized protein n=1 Tax=Lasiodiplodia mahajangana TaxID=1108764 RepID=A0ACC2K0F4_9PEZI|nr:hypothetical protein O1611_g454 [Lasiodiplodia mahajangana]
MPKRSFTELSAIPSQSHYLSALEHADNLLKAAQSLKQDLERLGKHSDLPSYENILSTLKLHNAQILPAAHILSQDETMSLDEEQGNPHKIQRVDAKQGHSDSGPQPGLSIPHPALLTKWTPEDAPDTDVLPPLPPALDPVLEKAARTHSGVASGLKEMNYERLEWIGDAYLLPAEFQPGGRQSQNEGATSASKKERKKILGDLLEAYAAAAILGDTDGLLRVATWLKSIWAITLKREIRDEYRKPVAQIYSKHTNSAQGSDSANVTRPATNNITPKTVLVQVIGTKGVTISYRDEGEPKRDKSTGLPWFTVGAYYDGLGETNLSLGYGSGISKKEAGEKAATRALENKKLIKRLQKLKEDARAALGRP